MNYRVEITQTAEGEAYEAYRFIAARSPENAARWYDGLFEAAASLRRIPFRCPLAPEARRAHAELRQLLFGEYRILFVVQDETVFVVHIRHAARRTMKKQEIKLP